MDVKQRALELHSEHKGKFEVGCKVKLENMQDLSIAYTPGVAEPCRQIAQNPSDVYTYTAKGNMVAVLSDGSAVLGLGNIGPLAGLPVMEGKAVLFKKFANIDAVPLCIKASSADEIVQTALAISPTFGGINLEDIASPICFEVEDKLAEMLDIPVFHDDQHGTAIVVAAALTNALRLTGKKIDQVKIVLNGPGAAGTAIVKMLHYLGARDIIACDEYGILHPERTEGMIAHKMQLCEISNTARIQGNLADALQNADVFVGVSVGGILSKEMVHNMAKEPIVFAMANPVPEIMYADAIAAGVSVMGTGRSDSPNQINNVLAFPGIFRGALDVGAKKINSAMKAAAVHAIAGLVSDAKLKAEYIIPDIFDERVTKTVADAVADAAKKTGVCRSENGN